ncbi:MAG: hypothetical protein HC853_00860 [Anaerolineae bacterium]|nr:hypothetical protein [Anaerolineae bacterium]
MHTARRWTGQWSEESMLGSLYDFGGRFMSPLLARFLSPDVVSKDGFNRYQYGFNSPLKYTDPSGHDPIDAAWEGDFRKAHKRDPNEQDRRDRLFSAIFKGSGADGAWTEADWARYGADRDRYWREGGFNGQAPTGIDSFASHVDTLATWYKPGEENAFVAAIGLVWGGIPYTNRFAGAGAMANPGPVWAANRPLFEGNGNWRTDMLDEGETNQSHHWAGFFYMGFFYETWVGYAVNRARDFDNAPDIVVGDAAVNHGRMVGAGTVNMSEVGDLIRQSFDSRPAIWGPNSPGSRSLSVFDHIP